MDDSALEQYFDKFIANDKMETEELMEEEEEEQGEQDNELFFSLLPDELLTMHDDHAEARTDLDPTSATEPQDVASAAPPATPVMPVTQQPEFTPQICNVVSAVNLGCDLDLDFIARRAWNVEYRPQTYNALIMRIREPQATASIYRSGKVVCIGAKSMEQSRLAARKCARIIQKLGFPVCFRNFKVHNVVASYNTFPLNLRRLGLHPHCRYEPELFPGLHYQLIPGLTVTIFSNGKMFLTGAKNEAQIYKAFDSIYPILSQFRR